MKYGFRKPSIKKRIKARTTGKVKRAVKKATIPGYGKKGMGVIKDPKKAVYNKIYNKTTVSPVPRSNKGSSGSGCGGCLTTIIFSGLLLLGLIIIL